MKPRALLSIVCLAAFPACTRGSFLPKDGTDGPRTLEGRVADKNGSPVASAAVHLVHGDVSVARTTTQDDGRFRFENPPTGVVFIVVNAGSGRGLLAEARVHAGGANHLGELTLGRLRDYPRVLDMRGVGFEERVTRGTGELFPLSAEDGSARFTAVRTKWGVSSPRRSNIVLASRGQSFAPLDLVEIDVEHGLDKTLLHAEPDPRIPRGKVSMDHALLDDSTVATITETSSETDVVGSDGGRFRVAGRISLYDFRREKVLFSYEHVSAVGIWNAQVWAGTSGFGFLLGPFYDADLEPQRGYLALWVPKDGPSRQVELERDSTRPGSSPWILHAHEHELIYSLWNERPIYHLDLRTGEKRQLASFQTAAFSSTVHVDPANSVLFLIRTSFDNVVPFRETVTRLELSTGRTEDIFQDDCAWIDPMTGRSCLAWAGIRPQGDRAVISVTSPSGVTYLELDLQTHRTKELLTDPLQRAAIDRCSGCRATVIDDRKTRIEGETTGADDIPYYMIADVEGGLVTRELRFPPVGPMLLWLGPQIVTAPDLKGEILFADDPFGFRHISFGRPGAPLSEFRPITFVPCSRSFAGFSEDGRYIHYKVLRDPKLVDPQLFRLELPSSASSGQ